MHDNIRREHHLADGAPCCRLQARGRHHLSAALHDAAAVADFYRLSNADTCCSRIQIRKNGVIDDLAVRRAKVYVGQAVHFVVVEGLPKVADYVISHYKFNATKKQGRDSKVNNQTNIPLISFSFSCLYLVSSTLK